MKTVMWVLSTVSMLVAVYETVQGRIDGAILFLVWSFYLRYLSDQNK